jgi:predicted O-methyltransferase YrrM
MLIVSALISFLLCAVTFVFILRYARRRIKDALVNSQRIQMQSISDLSDNVDVKLGRISRKIDHKLLILHSLSSLKTIPIQSDWQIQWELIFCLNMLIKELRPEKVLEFGSGYSTLIIANALKQNNLNYPLHSVENDLEYLDSTKRLLSTNEIDNVNFIHSPLMWSENSYWYNIPREFASQRFDLILIDGPHNDRKNGLNFFKMISHENSVFLIDDYFSKESNGLSEISNFFPNFEVRTFGIEREFGIVASRETMTMLKGWNLDSREPWTQ